MPRTVLLVDDDASIRRTFELQVARLGYEVHTAESAEAALSNVASVDPGVIVSDVRMPGLGGLSLLEHLRAARPNVPIVMITAHQDMTTAVAAMKSGAYDYLVKPLDLDRLELVLDRCFRERDARRRADRAAADANEAKESYALGNLVGRDTTMVEIYKTIGVLATNRAAVLVRGETGTGKEMLARAIHFNSDAATEPFVAVNCTAVPEALLESELFGHLRGAFTGATNDRRGRFELAGRGTIFLDEIGDTSPAFQAKLLRVLQDREFYPIGGEKPRRTEARVIAATHRPLEQLVRSGQFREDLYFRLRVVEIAVPPLRERRDDIGALAAHLLAKAGKELHKEGASLSADALRALRAYDWPGNVRELENTLTRALVLARGPSITLDLLALGAAAPGAAGTSAHPQDDSLAQVERAHVAAVLARMHGNKRRAARALGVSRSRLDRLLDKHGIMASERDTESRES
jgi:two-component system, NtrC family, response regulator AtoC